MLTKLAFNLRGMDGGIHRSDPTDTMNVSSLIGSEALMALKVSYHFDRSRRMACKAIWWSAPLLTSSPTELSRRGSTRFDASRNWKGGCESQNARRDGRAF